MDRGAAIEEIDREYEQVLRTPSNQPADHTGQRATHHADHRAWAEVTTRVENQAGCHEALQRLDFIVRDGNRLAGVGQDRHDALAWQNFWNVGDLEGGEGR